MGHREGVQAGSYGRGINQHTLEKICRREPLRAIKLPKRLKILEEIEACEAQRKVNE